jgi:transketolase
MRNTFIGELLQEAIKDPSIVLLAGDLGYGVTDEFSKRLPEQYINFGINEQSMMSAAAGMASKGFKPFVYSIGNFPTFRCLEQIRNDVSYMNLNVTIVALGAGFAYGTAGYSHHLIEDISSMSGMPHMKIYSPADIIETAALFPRILGDHSPKYIRLGKGGEGQLTADLDDSIFGVSIMRGSDNLAICSTGNIFSEVKKSVDRIRPEKKQPTLISIYDLQSEEIFNLLNQFENIITVEEHVLRGGFGSIVQENLKNRNSVVTRLGIENVVASRSGSQESLKNQYSLNSENISMIFSNFMPEEL